MTEKIVTNKKQKRMRAIGVGFDKVEGFSVYGQRVEDAMNELIDQGYAVHVIDQKNGILVLGKLPQIDAPQATPVVFGLSSILESIGGQSGYGGPPSKLGELISSFHKAIPISTPITEIPTLCEKVAPELLRGFGSIEIDKLREEVVDEKKDHDKMCGAKDCTYSHLLAGIASVLKTYAFANLQ
jgi:hypothetical protein